MSRTIFYGPKDNRDIEVRLYQYFLVENNTLYRAMYYTQYKDLKAKVYGILFSFSQNLV